MDIGNVYTDKVVITTPVNFGIIASDYRDLAESCGGSIDRFEDEFASYDFPNGGKLVIQARKAQGAILTRISLNGRVCAHLRLMTRFQQALAIVGQHPHRVTELHAKVDVTGASTPKLLRRVNTAMFRGGLHGYTAAKCQQFPRIRPDGQTSLNVYAPSLHNRHEKQVVYYDKRLEQHEAHGKDFGDTGDKLSIEFRATGKITRAGLSLRDADKPAPLFWHYMAQCPLIGRLRPSYVPDWVSVGSGYELPPYVRRTPDERLNDALLYGSDWKLLCSLAQATGREQEVLRQIAAQLGQTSPPVGH